MTVNLMHERVHTSIYTEEVSCAGPGCSHKPCLKNVVTHRQFHLWICSASPYLNTKSQYIHLTCMLILSEIMATDLSEANRNHSEIRWKRVITSNCLFSISMHDILYTSSWCKWCFMSLYIICINVWWLFFPQIVLILFFDEQVMKTKKKWWLLVHSRCFIIIINNS